MAFKSTTNYFCNKYESNWNVDFWNWTFNYLDLKFVFSDRKNPLIESFVDIF